jgi:hypothetical protein
VSEYCPTSGGSYTAYKPEYLGDDKEWHSIPTAETTAGGSPQPLANANINQQLGLFGYEQAWALAWQFAAHAASVTFRAPRIRVAQYDVAYDIKAKRLEHVLAHAE